MNNNNTIINSYPQQVLRELFMIGLEMENNTFYKYHFHNLDILEQTTIKVNIYDTIDGMYVADFIFYIGECAINSYLITLPTLNKAWRKIKIENILNE